VAVRGPSSPLSRQRDPPDRGVRDCRNSDHRRHEVLQSWHTRVLFCNHGSAHAVAVAPIDQKQRIERRMWSLLREYGLPLPDEVQYGERCVRFLWHDRKVAVVVDLDDFEEIDSVGDYTPERLTM
jgi:hypothetical protein